MPLKDTANRESSRHSCQDLLAQDHVEEPSAAIHPVPASQMGRWPMSLCGGCVSIRPSICPPVSCVSSWVSFGHFYFLNVCAVSVWSGFHGETHLPSPRAPVPSVGSVVMTPLHSSLGDHCCLLLSYHPSWRFVSFINLSGSLHSRNCASLKFFEQSSLDMEHLSKLTVRSFLLHLDELGRNSCEHTRPLPNPPLGASGSHLTSPMVLERSKCSLLDLGMWPSWENAHSSRIKPWV